MEQEKKQIRCQSCKRFVKFYGQAMINYNANVKPIKKKICTKCQQTQGLKYV